MFALLDPWPYLSRGIFGNLKESALFLQVHIERFGSRFNG